MQSCAPNALSGIPAPPSPACLQHWQGLLHLLSLSAGLLSSSLCAAPCRQSLNVTISILCIGTHWEIKQPPTRAWSQGETPDLPSVTTNEHLCLKELICAVRINFLQQPLQKARGDCRAQSAPLQLRHPLVSSGCG